MQGALRSQLGLVVFRGNRPSGRKPIGQRTILIAEGAKERSVAERVKFWLVVLALWGGVIGAAIIATWQAR
jgi:hypothetical protein